MQNKIKQDRTMNNLLTHYPVNWIDGMKLSSSHFIAVQDFVTDSVRDAIALQTTDLQLWLTTCGRRFGKYARADGSLQSAATNP